MILSLVSKYRLALAVLCFVVISTPVFGVYKKPKQLALDIPFLKNVVTNLNMGIMSRTPSDLYLVSALGVGFPCNDRDYIHVRYMGAWRYGAATEPTYEISTLYVRPFTLSYLHSSIGTGLSFSSFPNLPGGYQAFAIPVEVKGMLMLSKDVALGTTFTWDTLGKSSFFFTVQFGDPVIVAADAAPRVNPDPVDFSDFEADFCSDE